MHAKKTTTVETEIKEQERDSQNFLIKILKIFVTLGLKILRF
jgi:hypothetical protein